MTKPVDLDALDALYAKPHDGTPDDSPTAPEVPWVRRYLNLCAIEKATRDAYPAMAAEIRALREVAEAAREVAGYHRVYGTETIQDVNVDALRAALAKVPR